MITEEIYNCIINYANMRYHSLNGIWNKEDSLDIAHNVIVDENFEEFNWKHLVDRYIYKQRDEKNKIKRFYVESDLEKKESEIETNWICKGCQELLPKSCFKASHTLCGPCYYAKNKERILANNKRWRENNKDQESYLRKLYYYRDRKNRILKNKKWKEDNEDKIKEYSKKYYEENKEKIRAYQREYRKKNKNK